MPDEWTPEALAAEQERRDAYEATGKCPDSGYTIEHCWRVDLCDCSNAPPIGCPICLLTVWDVHDHIRRNHA